MMRNGSRVDTESLSDALFTLARKHQVPGAQLAIHQGGQTVAIEVGELEYGTGRLVERDAAFPIGSISKSFTSTLAMILVADGDIELETPLGEYLPELGSGADDLGGQLTLRQLLSHTSGLRAGPDSTEIASSSLRRYVLDNCRLSDLILPPGSNFSYSNSGYVLAGRLIEVITGMTWWDAMESILLRPLEIEPTFLATPDARPLGRPIATGHSVNASAGRTRPVEQALALAEAPAGGLAVSAVDLVNLGLIQLRGRAPTLLPSAYSEQMRRAVPNAEPFGLADGWGLGLAVFSKGNTVWVGHDGNADGTACYVRVEPVNGYVVAFTCNANIGLTMWQELVGELGKAGLPVGNYSTIEALGPPTALPEDCVGSYLNGDIEFSVTAQENGDLSLETEGEALPLVFHEGLIFSQEDPTSGQRIPAGRFLHDPTTGDLDLIQINGRVARRRVTHETRRR
jgi:CubicO group peptidase (beta-lactamase class C family)